MEAQMCGRPKVENDWHSSVNARMEQGGFDTGCAARLLAARKLQGRVTMALDSQANASH